MAEAAYPVPEPRLSAALIDEINAVVLGKHAEVTTLVAAVLAGGHVLLEDVPGVGKTLLAKAAARALGLSFGRVQCTSDLMPADLTGVEVYDPRTGEWAFRPGPLFHSLVLVDELNRTTPRTQSALLEAMAEAQVTVDGETRPLPRPFVVIATQNPSTDAGTFPLVPGQRDRFMVSLSVGPLHRAAERELLQGTGGVEHLMSISRVVEDDELDELRDDVRRIHVADSILDHLLDLRDAVVSELADTAVLSPRATQDARDLSRAFAFISGRDFVTPDDVDLAVRYAWSHRVQRADKGSLEAAQSRLITMVGHVTPPPV